MEIKDMLSEIRTYYPELKINKVISFNHNEYGFYDVKVTISRRFYTNEAKEFTTILPFPFLKYAELNEVDRKNYH